MGSGRGRPKKEIDRETFERLCEIQLKQQQICHVLGVTDKTLSGWCRRTYNKPFLEIYYEKKDIGVETILKAQFELAKKGNATMLIWLGKQYCGQSEKPVEDSAVSPDISEEVEALIAELDME